MHYMKPLSPDDILEQKEPQSKASKGELELRIEDGIKPQVFYLKNSMRLPENVLHYILNDYEPIQETMKENKQANLNFLLNTREMEKYSGSFQL